MVAPFRLSGSPFVLSCRTGRPASARPDPRMAKILLGAIPEFGRPEDIKLELCTTEVMVGAPAFPDPAPAATPKVVNSTVIEAAAVAVTMSFAQCPPFE